MIWLICFLNVEAFLRKNSSLRILFSSFEIFDLCMVFLDQLLRALTLVQGVKNFWFIYFPFRTHPDSPHESIVFLFLNAELWLITSRLTALRCHLIKAPGAWNGFCLTEEAWHSFDISKRRLCLDLIKGCDRVFNLILEASGLREGRHRYFFR